MLKKGRYVYYHCTANRGNCPHPFVREEVFTQHFSGLLENLRVPEPVVEWLTAELSESAEEEKTFRESQMKRLSAEEARLKKRLEVIYMDKLQGEIPLEVYQSIWSKTEADLARVRLAMAEIHTGESSSLIDRSQLLELARTAPFSFKSASNTEKRDLLSFMCSNCTYTDGNVQVSLSKTLRFDTGF